MPPPAVAAAAAVPPESSPAAAVGVGGGGGLWGLLLGVASFVGLVEIAPEVAPSAPASAASPLPRSLAGTEAFELTPAPQKLEHSQAPTVAAADAPRASWASVQADPVLAFLLATRAPVLAQGSAALGASAAAALATALEDTPGPGSALPLTAALGDAAAAAGGANAASGASADLRAAQHAAAELSAAQLQWLRAQLRGLGVSVGAVADEDGALGGIAVGDLVACVGGRSVVRARAADVRLLLLAAEPAGGAMRVDFVRAAAAPVLRILVAILCE